MITRIALGAVALATTCLTPLSATRAQVPASGPAGDVPFRGEIEMDIGGVMGTNANQAGRYGGFNSTGVVGGIGELRLEYGPVWDSGDARYFELTGGNLWYQTTAHLGTGLNRDSAWASNTHNGLASNGFLSGIFGEQGIWGGGLSYEAITYTGNVIDSLYSVNGGVATLNNGLAPWGGATPGKKGAVTSFTIAGLTATGAMQPFQIGVRRDIFGGNFKYQWERWTFTGAFRHEHKQGSLEQSFYGPYGGTAFAQSIDYDIDRYDITAAYNIPRFQGMVRYSFSHFNDNIAFINLPYPASNAAAPFMRSAAFSTPPSNSAHYLTFMAGTDVIPHVRVNLNARVGMEMQDNTFAPNTADPGGANLVGVNLSGLNGAMQGTTANSPGIMAEVYQLKLSATTRPLKDVDARVFYGLDGRNVSQNQYRVNHGGTGGGSDSNLVGVAFAVPQEWFKQNAGMEVGYRFLRDTNSKVTVSYRYDAVERSNAQVGHSATNTASVALTSEFGSDINGKLAFEYADRTGAMTYLGAWGYLGQGPTYSGAFYQAPMTSEAVVLRADYAPTNNLSGSFFIRFKNEDYHYAAATVANGGVAGTLPISGFGTGVKQNYSLSMGPDVTWRPSASTNLHFFYTYEQLFFNNLGNGPCSTAPITADCLGTIGYFQNQDTSHTHTVGISGDWQINEKLKVQAEYTVSVGSVMFAQFNGVFVSKPTQSYQNVANYPDINSLMHSIRVSATYQLRPNIDLILRGIYTGFHNNDWNDSANAIQGAGGTAISYLTPGYNSPNFSIGALLAGVKVRF